MPNLTITVDENIVRRARIRALEQGTSVNALLREYLEAYVGDDPMKLAVRGFLRLAAESESSSGKRGRSWTREDIYER